MLQRPKQCVELALKVEMHQAINSVLLQRQDGTNSSALALNALAVECDADSRMRSKLLNSDKLHDADRKTIISCVLIGIHFRDSLHSLHHSDCAAVDDFAWLSMVRMVWLQADASSTSTYAMKVFDYSVPYGFDINPGDSNHVTNPQTTRFNLGVLSALRSMCCCHALYGPSGCGKTSLMRNLAASLGRSFVSIDVKSSESVDRIPPLLTAAAASLVWIALDHVHTWQAELLSSFSQALLSTLAVIRSAALPANDLEHDSPAVKPDAARGGVLLFLTGPQDFSLCSSSILSSAVSLNFRPSQVTIPDVTAVAEAFFVVYGFDSAKDIARKINHFFTEWNVLLPLPFHQLSIKNVEMVASCARRIAGSNSVGPMREIECTGAAVRLVALPRCPPDLLAAVQPLVEQLFPPAAAATLLMQEWPLHADAVKPAFAMAQMTWCEGMGAVAAQLCSVIQVSCGVVVVGSCCSGKSSLIAVASSHASLRKPVVEMTSIDPNCCISQLFYFRSPSGVVSDGILNLIFDGSAELEPPSVCKWLHCDGDISSVSETLLSYTSVRQVLQRDPCAFFNRTVFETDNLQRFSPSHCGMLSIVHCPVGMLPHKIFLEDLVKTLKLSSRAAQLQVADLFLTLLPRTLDSLFPEGCGSADALWLRHRQLITNVFQLIANMFNPEACEMLPSACAKLFTFCLFWGLAGGISPRLWDEASSCYIDGDLMLQSLGSRVRNVCSAAAMLPPLSNSENLHEYCVSDAGDWCRWDSLPNSPLPLRGSAATFYVQTSRTAPCLHILTSLAVNGQHAALIGSRGSGKSVLVDALASKLSSLSTSSSSAFSVAEFRTLSTSDTASAPALELFLRNLLQLSDAGIYVPERSSNLVVVIDDLSSCPSSARPSLNSALRHFFGSAPGSSRGTVGGMYDPQKCGLLHRITGTSALVTASTSDLISPRAARFMVPVHLAAPSEAYLTSVFEEVTGAAFYACASDVRAFMAKLASVTASAYHQILPIAASAAAALFPLPHPSDCLKVIYACAASGAATTGNIKALHRLWLHEMCRVFRDRFATLGFGDFDSALKKVCSGMLEMQVADANISQIWTRFLSLDGLYAPVGNFDLMCDLLHSRLSEFHKKHKERISLVLDRASITSIASIARILQHPSGHCVLLNFNHASSRALCFFSGYVSDFNVVEMPAIDSAAAGAAFLRAVAVQCIEHNTQIALIINEEALLFDHVLELVAALTHGSAAAVFERSVLLHLAQRVSASLPMSGASTLKLIDDFASQAIQRNLKVLLLGSSSPTSPIAALPHVASRFTFHANALPQTAFFGAALQASLGSGFADFSVCGIHANTIADAITALLDMVLHEADRARASAAVKRKLADVDTCMLAVQVFCTDSKEKTETLANSIALFQNSISVFSALVQDAEDIRLKMQHLNQQIEHARMAHQDIAVVCGELKAASACTSRSPLETHKARAQLLSFADHLLVHRLSGQRVSFADNIGEALLVLLDMTADDMFGLPQDYFRGSGALSRIQEALKKKGCVPQPDSQSSFWMLEGISRYATLKQESIVRLQSVLLRSDLQVVYNSSGGTAEEIMDDFDKSIVEFLMSVHNAAREQELQRSQEYLEAAVQKEIDTHNTLDECAAVHASLIKMCNAMKPLQEKWKIDVQAKQLQVSRIVGDSLHNAVQLVWGVLFAPEHRKDLLMRTSECLSMHGIDAANSVMELNPSNMPLPFNIYESLAISSLIRNDVGIEWTLCRDPDERLHHIVERHVKSKDQRMIMSTVRSDDPSFVGTLERSVNDGHFLIVHVVQPTVPVILLELVRTRTLKVFGRPYLRIGSRMLEMHRNFKLVLQLSLLTFDDVPELFGSCRSIDFTLHTDYLEQYMAAVMVFEKRSDDDMSPVYTTRAELSREAVIQSEDGIMCLINKPSLRSPSIDFDIIESANSLLVEHVALQENFNQQQQHLDRLLSALESHKNVAKAAAHMLKSLRAMHSVQRDVGCSLPMLLDIFHHIVKSLNINASESLPVLFNVLSHHMAPVHRLIFAVLFSCTRDPQFTAPELIFLHDPIGLNVSPAVEGYEQPDTRVLDWLPLDVWARVAAFTRLPGVGVDVLKSLRSCADAWKKWYLCIEKGIVEQFPDGFSKKLTPLQCACLSRCFSDDLLRPTLQLYVARTLGAAYDASRFDPMDVIKGSVPAPVVIKETEGVNALSAVAEIRELLHGDSSVVCLVAGGTNWPKLVSKVSENLSAGRWVMVCCMAFLPWESFAQLHESAAKYHKATRSRLFIVLCASSDLPRDASAMCLHLNAFLSTAPNTLFDSMYNYLLPHSLPQTHRNMAVAEAYKHLGSLRQAVFQLTCGLVLAAQHDVFIKLSPSFDLRNRTFLKALATRCASAANALFRHSREFPVANLPKGYTYPTVHDIVHEALKELSDWVAVAIVSRFIRSLPSVLGSSAPPTTLQEQGGSDLTQHMSNFHWPSTLELLKIDAAQMVFVQGRDSRQLRVALQAVPCMCPCRSIPLIPFDSNQIPLLLDRLPAERELTLLLHRRDDFAVVDDMAACVGTIASMSISQTCTIMLQMRKLVAAAVGYTRGLVSCSDLLSISRSVPHSGHAAPEFSIFSSAGIMSLGALIEHRLVPQFEALKLAKSCVKSGISLGAFHTPFRMLSAARSCAARALRTPLESVRVRASVVTGLEATGLPTLAVCDVFVRNAILTTNKGNDCDTLIFGSQSLQPLPITFVFSNDALDGKFGDQSAAGTSQIVKLPVMLHSSAFPEGVFHLETTLVGESFVMKLRSLTVTSCLSGQYVNFIAVNCTDNCYRCPLGRCQSHSACRRERVSCRT
jgi:energy-coupling factor transporter ATP-binding protein EcfA2